MRYGLRSLFFVLILSACALFRGGPPRSSWDSIEEKVDAETGERGLTAEQPSKLSNQDVEAMLLRLPQEHLLMYSYDVNHLPRDFRVEDLEPITFVRPEDQVVCRLTLVHANQFGNIVFTYRVKCGNESAVIGRL